MGNSGRDLSLIVPTEEEEEEHDKENRSVTSTLRARGATQFSAEGECTQK